MVAVTTSATYKPYAEIVTKRKNIILIHVLEGVIVSEVSNDRDIGQSVQPCLPQHKRADAL